MAQIYTLERTKIGILIKFEIMEQKQLHANRIEVTERDFFSTNWTVMAAHFVVDGFQLDLNKIDLFIPRISSVRVTNFLYSLESIFCNGVFYVSEQNNVLKRKSALKNVLQHRELCMFVENVPISMSRALTLQLAYVR